MQPRAACGSGASSWQRLPQIPSLPGSQFLAHREVRRDRPRGRWGAGRLRSDLTPPFPPTPLPEHLPALFLLLRVRCPFPAAAAGARGTNHPSPRGPSPKPSSLGGSEPPGMLLMLSPSSRGWAGGEELWCPRGKAVTQVKTRGAHPAGAVYSCTGPAGSAALREMVWGH